MSIAGEGREMGTDEALKIALEHKENQVREEIWWAIKRFKETAAELEREVDRQFRFKAEEEDEAFAWFNDPVYIATYQIAHNATYLLVNLNLDVMAQHAAELMGLRAKAKARGIER